MTIRNFFEIKSNTYINPNEIVEVVPYVENSEFERIGKDFEVRMSNGSVYRINEEQFAKIDEMLHNGNDRLIERFEHCFNRIIERIEHYFNCIVWRMDEKQD